MLAETSLTNNQMSDKLQTLNKAINADSARYKSRIVQLSGDNDALLESFSMLKRSAEALQKEKEALAREHHESSRRIEALRNEGDLLAEENGRLKVRSRLFLPLLGQKRTKGTFGLRVKLPPVYHTRRRLHTVNAERQTGNK